LTDRWALWELDWKREGWQCVEFVEGRGCALVWDEKKQYWIQILKSFENEVVLIVSDQSFALWTSFSNSVNQSLNLTRLHYFPFFI